MPFFVSFIYIGLSLNSVNEKFRVLIRFVQVVIMNLLAFNIFKCSIILLFLSIGNVVGNDSAPKYQTQVAKIRRSGIEESRRGNYHKALEHFYKALNICEENSDSVRYALTLINLGNLNSRLEDYDQALELFTEALEYYERLKGNPRSLGIRKAQIINNLGIQLYHKKMPADALIKFHEALALYKKYKLEEYQFGYSFFGRAFLELGQYDSAQYYLDKSNASILGQNGDLVNYEKMVTYHYLGKLMQIYREHGEAIDYFIKSDSNAILLGSKEYMSKNSGALAYSYGETGLFELGLEASRRQKIYLDSLHRERNVKTIAKIESKYLLDRQEQMNRRQIDQRNTIIYFTASGLVGAIVIFFIWYFNARKRKLSERLLFEKNEQLNIQKINELLTDQEIKSIKANIKGQETERKRIAEELHDGIGGTLSSIKLQLANTNNGALQESRIKTAMHNIDRLCNEIRTISHNLIPPDFQNSAFSNLLNQYFDEYRLQLEGKFTFELYPQEELNNIDQRFQIEIYRIIQEALTNVLKHAQATVVDVQLLKHDNYVNLIIEDNGVGFDTISANDGIGLTNMHSRVQMLNGNFEIDSKKGRGTIVNVDLQLELNK